MGTQLKVREGEVRPEEQVVVAPVDAERAVRMVQAFENFKRNVLNEEDYVKIGDRLYVKKSGWSKYALACNISTEFREERVEDRNGKRIYHVIYRAIHLPTGRFADAMGSASEKEVEARRKKEPDEYIRIEHDTRSLAQTRAHNRAISNLVGGGEISAEEAEEEAPPAPRAPPRAEVAAPTPVKPERKLPRDLGEVEYRLSYHIPEFEKILEVTGTAEGFKVERKRYIEEEVWGMVNDVVRDMGGRWVSAGPKSHWIIPPR